jgi:hypothetical protein
MTAMALHPRNEGSSLRLPQQEDQRPLSWQYQREMSVRCAFQSASTCHVSIANLMTIGSDIEVT